MLLKPEDEERTGASNDSIVGSRQDVNTNDSAMRRALQLQDQAMIVSNARVTGFAAPSENVRIAFVVLHALRARERYPIVTKLLDQLPASTFLELDDKGAGSLGPWRDMLNSVELYADRTKATHICFLPDDCELVPRFTEVITNAVRARPDELICCQTNHELAPQVAGPWYTTPDGWSGFGGVMRTEHWIQHREWRETELRPDVLVQGDEGVNLWAMATGRLTYKTLPGLVEHILDVPSLDGNQHQTEQKTVLRRGTVFCSNEVDLRSHDWTKPAKHLGRSYNELHWRLLTALKRPMVRRAYEIEHDRPRIAVE